MTYESLSLLLEYLLAAVPEKDGWDIAEAMGSIVTAAVALVLVCLAIAGLHTWRTQALYERRLRITSDFMQGLHNVRIGFLCLRGFTKDFLLFEPEDLAHTQNIQNQTNQFALPIRNNLLQMRGVVVQADILGMPKFEDLMKRLFPISDRYFAVLEAVLVLRRSEPDEVAMTEVEGKIKESGYFERLGKPLSEDPLDRSIDKIEDDARDLCSTYLKTKEAWYRRLRFWETKKTPS